MKYTLLDERDITLAREHLFEVGDRSEMSQCACAFESAYNRQKTTKEMRVRARSKHKKP